MTDPTEPDLHALDQAARAASRGLRDHVARRVDPELVLATLPTGEAPRGHGRLLAAAAVAVLFVGTVAVLGDGPGGDERSRLELDEDGNKLPAPEPGNLTPLGPNDGRDSIQLPVTVEPSTDLQTGDVVTVSSPGFVPGERVGIVQCAREAGGEVREQRAGIDGCNTGGVSYADADTDGVATGTFRVERVLTTPHTGSVDCAAEAERCIVAMGALNDYDRSGGLGVAFAGGGEPIDIPTVTLSPSDGLADGDVVHVEGEGFGPRQLVTLNVCSIDPPGCWYTGDELTLDEDEVRELGLDERFGTGGGEYFHTGLVTDDDGRVSGDVPVWRFLPTTTPGTYIDCAVSACTLRITGESGLAPAPPALGFAPGGSGPRPPAIAVDPTVGLEPGDEIVVRGAGFEPGSYFYVSLCAAPPDDPGSVCGGDGQEKQVDEDGGFAIEFTVPDLDEQFDVTATTACSAEGSCTSMGPGATSCDGVQSICSIRVEVYGNEGGSLAAPQFPPAPVVVTFRG